ncbi:MAG: MAPEG family protein [Alphaproteobacteria bacterium]
MLDVTAFFAGILGLMLVALSINIIIDRYRYKVSLGDGGHADTNRKIRAQANFVEYVPFALILMVIGEISGTEKDILAYLGVLLVFGRISHAFSLLYFESRFKKIIFRQIGMVSTFTVIILLSLIFALGHLA